MKKDTEATEKEDTMKLYALINDTEILTAFDSETSRQSLRTWIERLLLIHKGYEDFAIQIGEGHPLAGEQIYDSTNAENLGIEGEWTTVRDEIIARIREIETKEI